MFKKTAIASDFEHGLEGGRLPRFLENMLGCKWTDRLWQKSSGSQSQIAIYKMRLSVFVLKNHCEGLKKRTEFVGSRI